MPVPFAVMAAGALVGAAKGSKGSGKPPTSLIIVLVVALLLVLLTPFVVVGGLVASMSSTMSTSVAAEVVRREDCPASPSDGFLDAQFNGEGKPFDNAEIIARVMVEEGLGQRGVQVAVYASFAEASLRNQPIGPGTSVGLFQQKADWAWGEPGNRKWKGSWSGLTAPNGEDPGEYFNKDNAWKGEEWAKHDSRMDPVAASRSFADSLRVRLEANGVDVDEWASASPDLSAQEAFEWALRVQKFGAGADRENYLNKYERAQPFVREALRRLNRGGGTTTIEAPVGDTAQNGVLIVGDSIAEGVLAATPGVGFGERIRSYAQAGKSAKDFVTERGSTEVLGEERSRKLLRAAPSRVVVSLGTNNPGSPEGLVRDLRQMVKMLPQKTTVYLLDVRNSLSGGSAAAYNSALRDFAADMTARENRPDVVVIDTQDIFADPVNRDEAEGSMRDGQGLPIHFSREGYKAVWERVSTVASGGDVTVATSVFPDCDPAFFSAPEQYAITYDVTDLQAAVRRATLQVDRVCAIESDPQCGEARKELEDANQKLLQAQELARRAQTAVSFARAQVGKQYVAEGNGPDIWDCSGLTYAAWKQADVSVGTHYSYTQFSSTKRLKESDVRPGDLAFWFESGAHHVAIVSAVTPRGIQIVEAANPRRGVVERYLGNSWDAKHLTGFGRVVIA